MEEWRRFDPLRSTPGLEQRMRPSGIRSHRSRWVIGAVSATVLVLGVRLLAQFPWRDALAALVGADRLLLAVAALVNLSSLVAKGSAWHLLLRQRDRNRWWAAQAATFAGAAVSCVSLSLGGEATRAQLLSSRCQIPLGAAVSALLSCRVVEGLALGGLLAGAALLLPVASWVPARGPLLLSVPAGLLVLVVAGAWFGRSRGLPAWMRWLIAPLVAPGAARALGGALGLSLMSWTAEWLTFHLSMLATHARVTPSVSLTALVAANLTGMLRLTPANVGVLQASVLVAMLPVGTVASRALAAGLALQAVQVLPVLAIGIAILGRRGLGHLARGGSDPASVPKPL